MKYGLLRFTTDNLGDEIQALAARRFLPQVDILVERDAIGTFQSPDPVKLICNAWWMHAPMQWPPSPVIRPLLISMHLDTRAVEPFFSEPSRAYFHDHGPVGCRDLSTLELFAQAGIDSYFSACLTLTFPRYDGPRTGEILLVDPLGLSDEGLPLLPHMSDWAKRRWKGFPQPIRKQGQWITHYSVSKDCRCRFQMAEALLRRYQAASLVITSRLHCALPCVAFGTPVLFMASGASRKRLRGLEGVLHRQNMSDLCVGQCTYDWCNPPPNPSCAAMAERVGALEDRCRQFVEG